MNPKHAKRRDFLKSLSLEERVRRHQKAMRDIELIWKIAEEEYCDRAGESRVSDEAVISAKCGAMYHDAVRFHRQADVVAAEAASVPVARAGER